jgi:5-aminolevulinate synthase
VDYGIYVQSINYPTVAVGEERLRITPTPGHTLDQLDHLVRALDEVFHTLSLKRIDEWKAVGGRANVGQGVDKVDPVWTDKQLGLTDGQAPKVLSRLGEKGVVDMKAVRSARARLNHLLAGESITFDLPDDFMAVPAMKSDAAFDAAIGMGVETARKVAVSA